MSHDDSSKPEGNARMFEIPLICKKLSIQA